jgi:hypothetical protein
MMTMLEKLELISIPLFGMGFYMLASLASTSPPGSAFIFEFIFEFILLPGAPSMGNLLLLMSSLLLLQGLVRDLSLLAIAKRSPQSAAPERELRAARCMCMESTVGITGILLGIGILGFGINQPIRMADWEWGVLVMLIMSVGFAIKDLVIETAPWRIVRDKDHMNIVFKWK